MDNYPPSTKLFSNVNTSVPESLSFLMEEIILKNRKGSIEALKRNSTAICHAVWSAVRPRSFISPLVLGVSIHLHRYFGSRRLIDILSSSGFCSSYKQAILYKSSKVMYHQLSISPPEHGCFIQHVGGNADHNVSTIDGMNTFHSMGIIRIVAPHDKVNHSLQTVPRLKEIQVPQR
ncbi:hypothetical protein AVEN_134369-1 [Araneus ventricosus]|uniref:Uncharacterized protein n=1 Tax=Araneus ventricosus TaxID=182803 RepID=A0A4Y2K728_ARAVE|nr:hypothetical protein AVEN_134369-1 [Araneus ventricosus]